MGRIEVPRYESKIVDKLVDFLRIFRAHTTPATVLIIIPFYALGGGNLWSWHGLFVLLWSILVHWSGYGGNSVSDAWAGYDQLDSHKQHFPLVSERIKITTGVKLLQTMLLLSSMIASILILYGNGDKVLSLTLIFIGTTAGFNYNSGINKVTGLKFLFLTLFGVTLAASCFYMTANPYGELLDIFLVVPSTLGLTYPRWIVDQVFLWGLLYCMFGAFYQIGWLGELKEILHPSEVNLLTQFGAKISEDGLFIPGKARLFGDLTKIGQLVSAFFITLLINNLVCWIILLVASIGALYFHHQLAKKRQWIRNETLTNSAKEEICVLFLLPLLLAPIVGWNLILPLILFSLIWYIIFNKLLWNTILRPQV